MNMCLEFLQSLSRRAPPVTLTSTPEVHQLYVLRAAGLVEALFLREPKAPEEQPEWGRFLVITHKGRQVLNSGVLPEEASDAA